MHRTFFPNRREDRREHRSRYACLQIAGMRRGSCQNPDRARMMRGASRARDSFDVLKNFWPPRFFSVESRPTSPEISRECRVASNPPCERPRPRRNSMARRQDGPKRDRQGRFISVDRSSVHRRARRAWSDDGIGSRRLQDDDDERRYSRASRDDDYLSSYDDDRSERWEATEGKSRRPARSRPASALHGVGVLDRPLSGRRLLRNRH